MSWMLCLHTSMEIIQSLSQGYWVLDIRFQGFRSNSILLGHITLGLRIQERNLSFINCSAQGGICIGSKRSDLAGARVKHAILHSAGGCCTGAACASSWSMLGKLCPQSLGGREERMHTQREIQLANVLVNSTRSLLKPEISRMKKTKAPLLTGLPDVWGKWRRKLPHRKGSKEGASNVDLEGGSE